MQLNSISPQRARDHIQQSALLLGVRGYPEWRCSHAAGAALIPLDILRQNLRWETKFWSCVNWACARRRRQKFWTKSASTSS